MQVKLSFKRDDSNGRSGGYYWVSGSYLIQRKTTQHYTVFFNGDIIGSCGTRQAACDYARTHAALQPFKGLVRP